MHDGFYEDAESLFVAAYDALHTGDEPQVAGDVAFYVSLAEQTGGPVLEVACGTGRITLPLAKAGFDVTGVDASAGMLAVARQKLAAMPGEQQARVRFLQQDMTGLRLDRRFGLIFVAFRSFQHLLTVDRQITALGAIRDHLAPAGKIALNLFDPRLDMLADDDPTVPPAIAATDAATGRRYLREIIETRFDHMAQTRHDLWRYAELAPDDAVVREDRREMVLRWTYRHELHHLLARCGFNVQAEYSDYAKSPPAYGRELIVVASAA